jgi:hypothetical protein
LWQARRWIVDQLAADARARFHFGLTAAEVIHIAGDFGIGGNSQRSHRGIELCGQLVRDDQ